MKHTINTAIFIILLILGQSCVQKDITIQNPKDNQYKTNNSIIPNSPEDLVQQQLDGYNARDIDAFLAPYSEEVEIYNFPNELRDKGKEKIKPGYEAFFARCPDLHCELVNRTVLGNTVIDHEKITGIPNMEFLEAIAIYKIENGKIAKVYFVSK